MIADRVSCISTTTGTGTLTLGAAILGFRTFAAAFPTPATTSVDYLIVDGNEWETGTGLFTVANTTLARLSVAASSNAGAAINCTGNEVVSVAYLSKTNIADWPVLVASRTSGTTFQTPTLGAFTTIQLNQPATVDTHGGWNPSTYLYTIPQNGVYDIQGKIRIIDNLTTGYPFGIGMDVANQDSPGFLWTGASSYASANNRQGGYNSRIMSLTTGQQIRLFTYQGQTAMGIMAAELNIIRVR